MTIKFDAKKLAAKRDGSMAAITLSPYNYKAPVFASGHWPANGTHGGDMRSFLERTDQNYGDMLKRLAKM